MKVLHINGVPVRVFAVDGRCVARLGVYGLVHVWGDNAAEVMGQVVALLGVAHESESAA